MRKVILALYILATLVMFGSQFSGCYFLASDVDKIQGVPKNVRNNPAAFRSFYYRSFTGK